MLNTLISGSPDYKVSFGLLPATEELYRIFNECNRAFFRNKLKTPVITIQSTGRRKNIAGWCSSVPYWKGTDSGYEINICAEYLNSPIEELVDTILHEMVHYFNTVNNIDDCVNGYHTKEFKKKAEEVGLIVKKVAKRGYADTELGKDTLEFAKWLEINPMAFSICRVEFEEYHKVSAKTKKKTITWKCSCSKFTIPDKIKIYGICENCGEKFQH